MVELTTKVAAKTRVLNFANQVITFQMKTAYPEWVTPVVVDLPPQGRHHLRRGCGIWCKPYNVFQEPTRRYLRHLVWAVPDDVLLRAWARDTVAYLNQTVHQDQGDDDLQPEHPRGAELSLQFFHSSSASC
ncbi:hypothetical protein RRG08_051595 [Elysia crispata]|uniref:Uncharacterized protein n=1 Tax=Elysia crispata TaxID=231223 RepID=A0AAE1A4F2_9GAST|nr:hypothetical protein RRG08_051595 [Elysia crispata]